SRRRPRLMDPLPRRTLEIGDPVSYISTVWIESGCLRNGIEDSQAGRVAAALQPASTAGFPQRRMPAYPTTRPVQLQSAALCLGLEVRFYMSEQYVETVIIGAGPCGLFQIFELGLLGINAHIIDSLPQPGGQCTELYPDKPIYDIPALPVCGAQELIDRLLEQAKPFNATFHLSQEVTELRVLANGKFHVATSTGTRLTAGAVVSAGGVVSFQPRRLSIPGADSFEGRYIHYRVRSAGDF